MSSRRVALDKRKRTETSCDVCKQRKQKCHRQPDESLCRYCKIHELPCTTNQPRKKRLYGSFESVGTRIQLLETLVKGLVPEADLSSLEDIRRVGSSVGISMPKDADASVLERHAGSTEEPLALVPDQQGSKQYTGPGSSFNLHVKLRSLLGDCNAYGFKLFGRNASEVTNPLEVQAIQQRLDRSWYPPLATHALSSTPDPMVEMTLDFHIFDEMVRTYFEFLQPDWPILNEQAVLRRYEEWSKAPSFDDRVWVCTLLCMCMLASRHSRTEVTQQQQLNWWRGVQALLPSILFTSSLGSVQVLLLAALHLQNTARRDACWNLTGAAIRIAHAIGLHNEEINSQEPPEERELRRMAWWALFSFEQLQISSYDRPSAIDDLQVRVGYPDERACGMSGHMPPDITRMWIKGILLLACACRARSSARGVFTPLSPPASALRDLQKWKESLPPHLQLESIEVAAPNYLRIMITLHTLYHYNTVVLTRSALLHRATSLSQHSSEPISEARGELTMSEACRGSGRAIARLMLKMHAHGKFNSKTWFDLFFCITGALSLVLDIVCSVRQRENYSEPMQLLLELAHMADHYKDDPRTPETLYEWARLLTELDSVVQKFCSNQSQRHAESTRPAILDACLLAEPCKPNFTAYQNIESHSMGGNVEQPWDTVETGLDVSAAFNMHDWHWADIEATLNA